MAAVAPHRHPSRVGGQPTMAALCVPYDLSASTNLLNARGACSH
jgi:hypothetical protein